MTQENEKELKEFLQDWIETYKDISERHALAETPEESADFLINQIESLGYHRDLVSWICV